MAIWRCKCNRQIAYFWCLLFGHLLLAVSFMNIATLIFALAAANPPAPSAPIVAAMPMTEVQKRDIGCVALLGLVADLQRGGAPYALDYPDVRETGKRWAGIVGQRVMDESGQPRELVAMAIRQSVTDWQDEMARTADPRWLAPRIEQCHRRMGDDLAVDQPLPKPETAQ